MIFNIVVYEVVRAVLEEVWVPQNSRHGIGWEVVDHNINFYANDGIISGRDPKWAQEALESTVAMLCRLGLAVNIENNKDMVCTLRFI